MRFFTSIPLIFLLSQQTNAFWPFTSSTPSAPEVKVVPAVEAQEIIDPQFFIQGGGYRSLPPGYIEYPNAHPYLNGEQILFQEAPEEEQTQQTEQTPDTNAGTKGGSSGSPSTKGGSTAQRKRTILGRIFWPMRKTEPKHDSVEGPVAVPVGVVGAEAGQEAFENHQTRKTPFAWLFRPNQAQPVPVVPMDADPAGEYGQPIEMTNGYFAGRGPFQPQFPYIKLPKLNIFKGRKPVVPQQQVGSQPGPGQYCQCFNAQTGQPIEPKPGRPFEQQQGFMFPYNNGLTDTPPENIVNNPYPVIYNTEQKNVEQGNTSPNHGPSETGIAPVSGTGQGNVRVVQTNPDGRFFDPNEGPTNLMFPDGTVNEPNVAETSVVPSTVPAPVPAPNMNNTPSVRPPGSMATTFSEPDPTVPTGTASAKTIQTFSGSVPGGSTTPQVMKEKEFSIGKNKFVTASTSVKNSVKKH